jgi:hypothetical protein
MVLAVSGSIRPEVLDGENLSLIGSVEVTA